MACSAGKHLGDDAALLVPGSTRDVSSCDLVQLQKPLGLDVEKHLGNEHPHVHRVTPSGNACSSGRIAAGMRVVSVDGVATSGMTIAQVKRRVAQSSSRAVTIGVLPGGAQPRGARASGVF